MIRPIFIETRNHILNFTEMKKKITRAKISIFLFYYF